MVPQAKSQREARSWVTSQRKFIADPGQVSVEINIMAVVTEPERTAAASFTSVPRTLTASLSPAIAGALFSLSWQVAPLTICGCLKISYDFLSYGNFDI